MPAAEFGDGGQVEGIAQRVGHEDRLGFAFNISLVELVHPAIQRDRIVVNKHRHEAVLDDGRDRGRKTRRHGDDLVAGLQLAVAEARAGQGGDGQQIGGGPGVA